MSTVPTSTPSFIDTAVQLIERPFIAVRDFVTPPLQFLANKIQNIWSFLQPYFASAAKFMTSKLGISIELLALSILPLQLSRSVDDKLISTALLTLGVFMAAAGGFFLCSSGVLPSFITNVTPVVAV
jgi:hypothetical protein